MTRGGALVAGLILLAVAVTALQNLDQGEGDGYDDTPVIPGQQWKVHDKHRPRPAVVTPGAGPGQAPSDAIVLFDGSDLSRWEPQGDTQTWTVKDGYVECVPHKGDLITKDSFGDVQLHIEWASPNEIDGTGQNRGNSGVILMKRYEVQVLDSWNNPTYADGQAGAIYGWWPPRANASRAPGEWQTYDIIFEAPRFSGDALQTPAHVTVLHNGALLHHRREIGGPMAHRVVRKYEPHPEEQPLLLQNHNTRVRYRNIWVRKLQPQTGS
ncbi:MAG TPA: DUF1080 domain-containing protein [Bryobacteraceae bacterium]|nr:DUF1080 domain-containing protein [Bryobacteraceae bacterium]